MNRSCVVIEYEVHATLKLLQPFLAFVVLWKFSPRFINMWLETQLWKKKFCDKFLFSTQFSQENVIRWWKKSCNRHFWLQTKNHKLFTAVSRFLSEHFLHSTGILYKYFTILKLWKNYQSHLFIPHFNWPFKQSVNGINFIWINIMKKFLSTCRRDKFKRVGNFLHKN